MGLITVHLVLPFEDVPHTLGFDLCSQGRTGKQFHEGVCIRYLQDRLLRQLLFESVGKV